MRRLFILYDARCGLCTWARRWLSRQPAFLEMTFVPARSEWAERLFPDLGKWSEADELIVVSDEGGVYRGGSAWIMCLYALQEYREWSERLARPMLLPLARQAFALVSKRRRDLSRWLDLASEAEMAETLRQVISPACASVGPEPEMVNGQV
jgi:predicted DCC family thiol-disulfide oxidoreductase YuxK